MSSANRSVRREANIVFTNLILTTDQARFLKHVGLYENYIILEKFVLGLNDNDATLTIEILQALYVLLGLDEQL